MRVAEVEEGGEEARPQAPARVRGAPGLRQAGGAGGAAAAEPEQLERAERLGEEAGEAVRHPEPLRPHVPHELVVPVQLRAPVGCCVGWGFDRHLPVAREAATALPCFWRCTSPS